MRVAIVIPTWNNSKWLKITIDSLLAVTQFDSYRVIVVDNGSGLRTQNYLEGQPVEVIRLDDNKGFVVGTNAGLDAVTADEHVCLLNDDVCIVDPDWLSNLVSVLSDKVGAVGPVSNYVVGTQNMLSFSLGTDKFKEIHNSPFLSGYCMLISKDAFRKVGKLDPAFNVGGIDDLDYSIRLKQHGYELKVHRGVFVFHWGSLSISKIHDYEKQTSSNRAKLQKKWGAKTVAELSHVDF